MIDASNIKNHMVNGVDDERGATLSPAKLADEWGVHVKTVYRDIRKGALRAFRLPGGRFRIRKSDADRYGRPIE